MAMPHLCWCEPKERHKRWMGSMAVFIGEGPRLARGAPLVGLILGDAPRRGAREQLEPPAECQPLVAHQLPPRSPSDFGEDSVDLHLAKHQLPLPAGYGDSDIAALQPLAADGTE